MWQNFLGARCYTNECPYNGLLWSVSNVIVVVRRQISELWVAPSHSCKCVSFYGALERTLKSCATSHLECACSFLLTKQPKYSQHRTENAQQFFYTLNRSSISKSVRTFSTFRTAPYSNPLLYNNNAFQWIHPFVSETQQYIQIYFRFQFIHVTITKTNPLTLLIIMNV